MNRKIIIEDNLHNIQTKKPIRKLELWEEEKGFSLCRRLYIFGDTNSRNKYIDRFDLRDVKFTFTLRDVINSSLDIMLEKLKQQHEGLMNEKNDRLIYSIGEELKAFKSPTIKHIENFNYDIN